MKCRKTPGGKGSLRQGEAGARDGGHFSPPRIEAFSELRQAIRIIGIGLVERFVQYLVRVPRFNADRRHVLARQRVIERRLRSRFEYDALGVRGIRADHLCQRFGSEGHLPRQIRLPSSRLEIAVYFQ